MQDVAYLAIAVRQRYSGGRRASDDFAKVCLFLETLYASDRLKLPLKGVLVLGY